MCASSSTRTRYSAQSGWRQRMPARLQRPGIRVRRIPITVDLLPRYAMSLRVTIGVLSQDTDVVMAGASKMVAVTTAEDAAAWPIRPIRRHSSGTHVSGAVRHPGGTDLSASA